MDIHTKHNFSKAELRIPAKKNPRSKSPTRKKQASTQIQFKDYTKLNLNNSASGS